MRKNLICNCGTPILAPIEKLRRGIGCPACGNVVVFEEQFDPGTRNRSDRQILDFRAKKSKIHNQTALLPGWIRFSAVVLVPLLLSMLLIAFLRPAMARSVKSLGFLRKLVPAENLTIVGNHHSFEWSKAPAWNTSVDSVYGSFEGHRVVKEFTTLASASMYRSIEKLFVYDRFCNEVCHGRNALKSPGIDSEDSIERQCRELVTAFLDNTQRVTAGYHDWRLIGVSKQADQTALLVRYYRENLTPVDLLDNEEILKSLSRQVSFDVFNIYCGDIFRCKVANGAFNPKLQGYSSTNFFADSSFGYVVLIVSGDGLDMAIEDLLDYQVQRPLSQLCMRWVEDSDQGIASASSNFVQLSGPSHADIQSIQSWIGSPGDSFSQIDRQAIRENLSRLYSQTNDPLMCDLMGRLESDFGNKEGALEYFSKAKASGFQSLESHRQFIGQAIESKSLEQVLARLNDLNNYWNVKLTGLDAEEDRRRFYKFEGYWRRGEAL